MSVEAFSTLSLAGIFKALAEPKRLEILLMLRDRCGGLCRFEPGESGNTVSEIADAFDISLSTVSHHLKELKNAGLIECVKRGQWVYCSPNPQALARVREFLDSWTPPRKEPLG